MPMTTLASLGATVDNAPQINQAIADLASAGGGVLNLPDKTYGIGVPILFPLTRPYGPPVTIRGSGEDATTVQALSDFGAGTWAVRPDNLTGPGALHRLEDLNIRGVGAWALGSLPCQMSGVRTFSRFSMHRVRVTGFNVGLDVINDHQQFTETNVTNCLFNVLANDGIGTGDVSFIECDLTGATHASLAVSGTFQPNGWRFYGSHMGFAPYGVWGIPGTQGYALVDFSFINCAFEACGNAGMCTNNRNVTNCRFERVPGSYSSRYQLPGVPRGAFIDLGSGGMSGCHISHEGTFAPSGPTVALVAAGGIGSTTWDNAATAISVANKAGIPFARCSGIGGEIQLRDGTRTMTLNRTNIVPVAIGSLLGLQVFGQVTPMTAFHGVPPYGVAATAATAVGDWVVSVVEGRTMLLAGATGFRFPGNVGPSPDNGNVAANVDPTARNIFGVAADNAAGGGHALAYIRPQP